MRNLLSSYFHRRNTRYHWARWVIASLFVLVSLSAALAIKIHNIWAYIAYCVIWELALLFVIRISPFTRYVSWVPFGNIGYDERELSGVLRAYELSYRGFGVIVLFLLYFTVGTQSFRIVWPHSGVDCSPLLLLGVFIFCCLPTLIAEWTIPMLPKSEDEA